MAYQQVQLLAVVAAVACLASLASGVMVWVVGDQDGWRPQFNQTNWADGKTFVVGDKLLFVYGENGHTVAQVGKDDFAACNVQGNMLRGPWSSGTDIVLLDKPGKAWFICTKPNHCLNGMKLAIDVVEAAEGPEGPSSSAPAVSYTTVGGAVAVAGAVAAALLAF